MNKPNPGFLNNLNARLLLEFVSLAMIQQLAFADFSKMSVGTSKVQSTALQVVGDQYLTSDEGRVDSADSQSLINIDLFFQKQRGAWNAIFQGSAQQNLKYTEEQYSAIPQIYGEWDSGWGLKLSFGRKLHRWSLLDQEWELGVWQPSLKNELIHPQEQGLIGLFNQLNSRDWQLLVLLSPVFLPDQGPHFTLNKGTFTSHNRWFSPPPSRLELLNREEGIYYELDKPKVNDVIFQPSWALQLKYGTEERGFWTQWAVTEKPMNQMHFGLETYRSAALDETYGRNMAIIHVREARHWVGNWEMGQTHRDEGISYWMSYSVERPEDPHLNNEWDQPPLKEAQIMGLHLNHPLPLPGLAQSSVSWNWVQVDEQKKSVRASHDSSAAIRESAFSTQANDEWQQDQLQRALPRYPVLQAVSVQWNAQLDMKGEGRLGWRTRYSYSLPDDAGWLSTAVQWTLDSHWQGYLGVDILGTVHSPSQDEEVKSIYSQFRQNDRIAGGLTYVF